VLLGSLSTRSKPPQEIKTQSSSPFPYPPSDYSDRSTEYHVEDEVQTNPMQDYLSKAPGIDLDTYSDFGRRGPRTIKPWLQTDRRVGKGVGK
jgi:hypothetical protein